jgi:hypothetical protein
MKTRRNLIQIWLLAFVAWCSLNPAFAQIWIKTSATSTNWQWIASSADGTKLAALNSLFGIYASTNSGNTWQNATNGPILSNAQWSSLASSADGNKFVASAWWYPIEPGNGGIFVSTNSGIGWTKTSTMMALESVAFSADGTKMAAGVGGGGLYTSTDTGKTWTLTSAPSEDCNSISSSPDGTKLVAAVYGGGIYISTNSGATWIQTGAPSKNWSSLASSADGIKLAAAVWGGGIYLSTNSGTGWTPSGVLVAAWNDVASSADGSHLVVAATNGLIFTSTNSGTAWKSNSVPTNYWVSVTSSADGTKLAAVVWGGGIYTSYTVPKPSLCFATSNKSLAFSWIMPSTNFVVQRISDLSKANWTTLTNVPALNLTNLQNQVILPPPGSNVFYRLKTP